MSASTVINALINAMTLMSPNTGDTRNPVILIVIGIIAAILIALVIIMNVVSKKNKK